MVEGNNEEGQLLCLVGSTQNSKNEIRPKAYPEEMEVIRTLFTFNGADVVDLGSEFSRSQRFNNGLSPILFFIKRDPIGNAGFLLLLRSCPIHVITLPTWTWTVQLPRLRQYCKEFFSTCKLKGLPQ